MCCDIITTQWQCMRFMTSADLIGHIKFLLWQQLDGYSVTRLSLSLRRVWLVRVDVCMVNTWYAAWQVRGSLSSVVHLFIVVSPLPPPLSFSPTSTSHLTCHLCDEWFQVFPIVSHSHFSLCYCQSKPKNKQGGLESRLKAEWLPLRTVYPLFPRDPRLVPMTYGPQAVYRPIDNGLGRLRVTVSQVRDGRL